MSPFEATIDIKEQGLQKYILNIYLHSTFAATPPSFNLSVKFPKDKINQIWNSKTWSNKSYFTIPSYDRAAANFSIISGLTINDHNQITVTCKDAYKAKFVSSNIKEEGDSIVFSLGFFEDNPPLSNLQDYQAEVWVDFRSIHFSKAIYDASSWFLEDEFKKGVATADTTNVPVFSTWYPMHRNIPLENITRDLDSLKTFNFKSVLVDDGWQSLVQMKIDTAYSYDENSFKTMSLFKKKCSDMGLPLYLWYSIPFIGGNPVILKKFDGKYIRYRAPRQMFVLDPRYSDVRKYLVSTYANFLSTWNFDGYWFDFLKGFYPKEGAVIDQDKGRDFVSIDLAVDTLYSDMKTRLNAIKPNFFMGQIFSVVGPNLVSYQNFLTGFVGVENTQVVREKMVNNRLLYGKFTPFMEVVAINQRESEEDIARKLQSVLFGNPYLSFYVTTLPEASKQTIRFWLDYWKTNHKVIFEGSFEPMQVSRFYPGIKVENEQKIIYMVYEDYTINLPVVLNKPVDVINSKTVGNIQFLLNKADAHYNYEIFDCKGVSTEKGIVKCKSKNAVDFAVPTAGFIRITPGQ
ncbi:alpha-galactosidase [Aquipluma nitroreducens]|uniref:Alpha-galactosidase n=2 Tax=Aquipluma nitroreducens TaxID=2010828 RepID=A0A5K7S4I6_9BACT|nr:alpha-galactosidase [Aquipluma nitroreducens]